MSQTAYELTIRRTTDSAGEECTQVVRSPGLPDDIAGQMLLVAQVIVLGRRLEVVRLPEKAGSNA